MRLIDHHDDPDPHYHDLNWFQLEEFFIPFFFRIQKKKFLFFSDTEKISFFFSDTGDPTGDTGEPDRRRQETPHLSARRKGALYLGKI